MLCKLDSASHRAQTFSNPAGCPEAWTQPPLSLKRQVNQPPGQERGPKNTNCIKGCELTEPGKAKAEIDRAARIALRLPLRFRLPGQENWSIGETVNVSHSGLLFWSESTLEVDTSVEITFQISGVPLLSSSKRQAHVVRRILSNWPETRPMFGARFSN